MFTMGIVRQRDEIREQRETERAEKQAKDVNDKIMADAHQMEDLLPRVANALRDIKKALQVSETQAATIVNTELLPPVDQWITLETDSVQLWESIPADRRSEMVVDGTKRAHAFLDKLRDARAKFAAAGALLAQGDARLKDVSALFEEAGMALAQP